MIPEPQQPKTSPPTRSFSNANCQLPIANYLLFAQHSALSTVLDPVDFIRVLKEIKNEN